MKIAYNPKAAAALTAAPANDDITFDLSGLSIYVKGVRFKGTDTTYSVFKKHGSSGGGYDGLVPVPNYNNDSKTRFLREDGTWVIPTDSHYTTHLYVGAQSVSNNNNSNASTTNGNTYIKLFDNSTLRHLYLIKGSGNTTVNSDAGGNITINSPTTISWGNVTEKPGSFTPATHYHNLLKNWPDTRDVATIPNDYNAVATSGGVFKVVGIKTAGTLGLTSTLVGNYATIIGWRGWNETSGGYAWEIASTDKNRLYVRSGSTTSWNNGWSAIAYTTDTYPTSQINKLTGYTKAISAADLAVTDTLNQALGKLEYKTDTTYKWYQSITEDDNDDVINKWHEIVDFIDSVKEGTDILDEFVTRKTALVITGQKNFNTNSGETPVIISRLGGSSEAVAIGVNDYQAIFEYTNDEELNSYVFKMINTDTELSDGSGANTSQVIFTGNSSGSSVIADTFIGRLNNTLTFSAGTFAAKTYNNSSTVTVNIPTHTSHLVNNSGFLTLHQSLANYVTLDTALTITGMKTFSTDLILFRSTTIILSLSNTSHYSEVIKWLKGGTSLGTYDPSIGQHNIGGDGTGSICILPYPTEIDPWSGTVGLFIRKYHVYIDGKELANTANGSVYFTEFSGGEITSSENTLTQANHSITIGGQTRTVGASTCNIINSLSVSTITSSAATNLILGLTVNGVVSTNKTIPDLYAASIRVKDVRGDTRLTTYWESKTANFWFNYTGTPSYEWYSGITIKGWTDDYLAWELASGSQNSLNGNLYYRNGLNGTWLNWLRIMFASELPGLFTDFSNAGSLTTSISIGGTTKTLKIDADTVDNHHAGYLNNNVALLCPWPDYSTMKNAGFLPNEYGTSGYGHPDDIYLLAICKWAIATYSNLGDITLIGKIVPNDSGTCILHLYSSNGKDSSTLLPRYCSGTYTSLLGYTFHFGTVNYSWYYKREALTSDIPIVTDYYWANVPISNTSSNTTSPTFAFPTSIYSKFTNRSKIIGYIGRGDSNNNNLYFGNYENADMCIYTDDALSKCIYLKTGGNVGIGTIDPAYKLHVTGDIYTTTGFKKNGSSDSYVLLGGGGHKLVSDFMLKTDELSNNLTTITKSLNVTQAWMDTGITSTDIPANGTYIVLVQVSANNNTGWMYNCYSSGVMSWYKNNTNDTETDEIILHRSGHAYGKTIYLRTVMQSSGVLKLLIGASSNIGNTYTYTFKFKRII